MNLLFVQNFFLYAGMGIIALVLWTWAYQVLLSRGYSLRDALFGRQPNPAVALDFSGGIAATGILIYSTINNSPFQSFWLDFQTAAITLAGMLVLLTLVRFLGAVLLRMWFGDVKDGQGEFVTLNNELYRQENIATGLFSMSIYLMMAAGVMQVNLLDLWDGQLAGLWNMLGIWLMGFIIIVLHSFFYLGYGPRNNILHECFYDNNPAAPISLLGLTGGYLLLVLQSVAGLGPFDHVFSSSQVWLGFLVLLVFVLVARGILQLILYLVSGINLRWELVIHDNVAWGVLDGMLIFALSLILVSLNI